MLFAWLASAPAFGQWSYQVFHPPFGLHSEILAIGPTAQAGYVDSSASLWLGSTPDWTSLGPGVVRALTPEYQVGDTGAAATLWRGTPQSRVFLHPAGAFGSTALTAFGDMQGGSVFWTSTTSQHAVIWNGTASSYRDLHPVGAVGSEVSALDATYQWGGTGWPDGRSFGGRWAGTAASFFSMNPGPQWSSYISAAAGGQQVGFIWPNGSNIEHAAIWSGTPESAIDVHPSAPGGESAILATTGRVQVGWFGGGAGAWFGTRESFVSLHALVPGAAASRATCVEEHDGIVRVGGWVDTVQGRRAVVWTLVPVPGSAVPLALGLLVARRRRR